MRGFCRGVTITGESDSIAWVNKRVGYLGLPSALDDGLERRGDTELDDGNMGKARETPGLGGTIGKEGLA